MRKIRNVRVLGFLLDWYDDDCCENIIMTIPEQTLDFVCRICEHRAIMASDYHSTITKTMHGILTEKGIFN
jgi:hypothetical protein